MILTNSSKSRWPSPSLSTLLTSIRVSSWVRQFPAALFLVSPVAASLITNRLVPPGYQWTFNKSPRCPEHTTPQLTTLPGQSCGTQIMLSWAPDGNCVSLDGQILTDKIIFWAKRQKLSWEQNWARYELTHVSHEEHELCRLYRPAPILVQGAKCQPEQNFSYILRISSHVKRHLLSYSPASSFEISSCSM